MGIESCFEPVDDPEARPVNNRAGWRKGSGAAREWMIPSETWKAEICHGLDPKLVAKVLAERGLLLWAGARATGPPAAARGPL